MSSLLGCQLPSYIMKGTVFIAVIFKNMQQLQNDAENITALGFDLFVHH